MQTPKEKAEELVNKYLLATPIPFYIEDAKQCALICVNEIQNTDSVWDNHTEYRFYEEVKQEIKLL